LRISLAAALCFVGVLLTALSFAANQPRKRAIAPASAIGNWTIVSSPSFSPSTNYLFGVNCASASQCFAVGYTFDGAQDVALIEKWNGTSWAIVQPGGPSGELMDVTCVSANECWSAGYSSGMNRGTLIERWSGNSWSVVPSPNMSGFDQSVLRGVTCASPGDCWAVGFFFNYSGGSTSTLTEHWNGAAWAIVSSPNGLPAAGGNVWENYLTGATCSSSSDCWAVGYALTGTFAYQTLIQHWDGTSWQIVPSPTTNLARSHYLHKVTCSSASDCWAVGYYDGGSGFLQNLILHWNGNSWSIVASPNAGTARRNMLLGVTCSETASCWATGIYADPIGYNTTLILHWDGTSWSLTPSPNAVSGQDNVVGGVTCASAYDCWTVGNYNPADNASRTLTLHYSANPMSILSIAYQTNGHIFLQGQATPNVSLSLEAAPDLGSPFLSLGTTSTDGNGAFQFEDFNPENLKRRFYRASMP
jgi:hypothetical protein